MGYHCLTKDGTRAPSIGSIVSTTGPPGKLQDVCFWFPLVWVNTSICLFWVHSSASRLLQGSVTPVSAGETTVSERGQIVNKQPNLQTGKQGRRCPGCCTEWKREETTEGGDGERTVRKGLRGQDEEIRSKERNWDNQAQREGWLGYSRSRHTAWRAKLKPGERAIGA